MPEASILVTLRDQYSPGVQAMRSANSSFGKSLEETQQKAQAYQTRLAGLVKQQGELQVQLVDAKKALKEAESAYKATGEAADADALASAKEKYEALNAVMKETAQASKDTQNALRNLESQSSSLSRNNGSESGLLSALSQAGLLKMAGDAAGEWANTLVGSAFGSDAGSLFSGALTGAASGAALGSFLPGIGTAIGAAIGGGIGLASAGSQIYQQRDEAFKSYVQEAVEGQLSEMDTIRASGSATAGQREQDQIAFAQRFGSDLVAQDYLNQVKAMATGTNYTYDEITGYSKSLLNTYSADETLDVLQKLSDATAGLNLDSGGVSMFIASLSRMRTTGKLTQEYMNAFSERGLDADEAIAQGLGLDKSQVREMASDGEIGGMEAAQAILDYIQEEFGGLSEKLASTYDAMVDNLGDAEANLNARMGEGYNQARKQGLADQQEWLESEDLGEAYEAIGAWKAELDNAKEKYIRDAVNEAMGSKDYETARAEGDAAEMGRIIMQAKINGMNEYNANEGKDEVLAQELALIEEVRNDTALNDAYWDAGYRKGQEFSKGLIAGQASSTGFNLLKKDDADRFNQSAMATQDAIWSKLNGYATGLGRVPYNNYPALLHEGERVLTAAEARGYDQGGTGSVQIVMNGTTIREDADIDRVAQALLDKLRQAKTAGVYR